jgi:glycosyltransferase involved in cell wall biosynthesis
MATYNGARHLEAQLQSLVSQTCLPEELIIGDDGSSDGTVGILSQFAQRSPFPVIIRQNERNLGFGDNFLTTALLARSPFIAFCDQDDIWEAQKIASIRAAVIADPALILVSHPSRLLRDGQLTNEQVGPAPPGIFAPLTRHPLNVINGHALAFRRTLLEVLPPQGRPLSVHSLDRRMPHDDWITFLGHALGRSAVLPESLVRYRVHSDNISGANERRSGWREYLRRGVLSSAEEVEKDHRATLDRAAQLSAIRTNDAGLALAAERAAQYYQKLADLYGQRVELWRVPSRFKRAFRFISLWKRGVYAGFEAGAASKREAQKDLLFGVLQLTTRRKRGLQSSPNAP